MAYNNENIANELLKRLRDEPPQSLKDTSIPLALNTLSKTEFSVAMSNKWLTYRDKRYYFSDKLVDTLKHPDTATPPKPSANQATSPESARQPVPQAPKRPQIGELSDTAQGPSQLKILEIIFRGKNKLGHPNLLLMGETGDKVYKRVERGIPLTIANEMMENPNTFNGRVISIDEKSNFVGIVLAQKQKKVHPKITAETEDNEVSL